MKLGHLGEFALLDRLGVDRVALPPGWLGPGDDAALIPFEGFDLVVTTDLLLEEVHFRRRTTSPEALGAKALAVNLSDLAAMGAWPLASTVAAAFPADCEVAWIEALYRGFTEAGTRHGCPTVGGDTSAGERVLLTVTAFGRVERGKALLRTGAKPGEALYLSGVTGESGAGLRLLEAGIAPEPAFEETFRRHLTPEPRLALGRALAESGIAGAAIDVSDGVVQDAGHVARRSGAALHIEAARLPLSAPLRAAAEKLGLDPLALALTGGEDYEILFTADPLREAELSALAEKAGVAVTRIGRVESGTGEVRVVDGAGRPLAIEAAGFDHFR